MIRDLYHSLGKFTRQQIDICLIFLINYRLIRLICPKTLKKSVLLPVDVSKLLNDGKQWCRPRSDAAECLLRPVCPNT